MCGTAPVTPPAGAFELVVEESHWDKVYHAIEYIKRGPVSYTHLTLPTT